ncbi:flagellar filament capping protein FliD [Paraconexibacter sp.]|uniref:flagellar filament capping protein FliD n=1 Tax=Paraconexibacter sp. TaxID=2949640 RepID=UPI003567561A
MSPISFSGMASGLDTDAIITSLMQVERAPRIRLELRQQVAQARQDALGEIKGKLTALQTAATGLRSAATWGEVQAVESSDSTKVTARQTAGAAPGGVRLEVTQLARAPQKTFDYVPPVGAGQLVIGGATIALSDGATLDEAVSAINQSTDAGVYAVNVAGRLVLSGKTTGAASSITAAGLSIIEDVPAGKAGLDAQFTVDGVPGSASSNVVTSAVPGVELTLKGLTSGEVTVTVGPPAPDKSAVEAKVKAFVDAYNVMVDTIRAKLTEKRVPDAQTSADAKKGVLFGDQALSSLLSSLRSTVGAVVGGNPQATDALEDLGITTGIATGTAINTDGVAGRLSFDTTKFRAALDADPTAVQRLLGGAGVDGFAQAFESVLTPTTQAGGSMEGATQAAAGEVTRLKDQMARLDDRLAAKEERLRQQFTALETALARSQAQQSSLLRVLGTS